MPAPAVDTTPATAAVGRLREARAAGAKVTLKPSERAALTGAAWALRSGGVSVPTISKVLGAPEATVERWLQDTGTGDVPAAVRRAWKIWARERLAEPQKAAPPRHDRAVTVEAAEPVATQAPAAVVASVTPTRESVVVADAITKTWGSTHALAGASLTIGHGVTGLLGANGAGKTTFLGMVLGLHKPDSGTLQVFGLDPMHAGTDVRERIGYSPESDSLPTDVKAHDLVRHMAEIHGIPRRAAVARASDALYLVGLGEERFRPVGTMSTGQKQRVKLAQAVVHDPMLVLLDEPTNGLDPVQRDEMLTLIVEIGHDLGLNVVLCSHLLEEVERVCDSVIILDAGSVVASGTVQELRGEGSDIIVDVDADAEAFAKLLGARVEGSRVIVPFAGDETYDIVRDAAAKAKVAVRRFGRRQASLEDVFLGVKS